jgi:hypothetical protein
MVNGFKRMRLLPVLKYTREETKENLSHFGWRLRVAVSVPV